MKAYLSYNPLIQSVELKIENYEFRCQVYDMIGITGITNYEKGFLTVEVIRPESWHKLMQPHLHMLEGCINEEYIDFIDAMKYSFFSEKFINTFTTLLDNLKFEDIVLEIGKYDMED